MKFFQWSPHPDAGGDPNAHEWAEFNLPSDFGNFIPEPPRPGFVEAASELSPKYDADFPE